MRKESYSRWSVVKLKLRLGHWIWGRGHGNRELETYSAEELGIRMGNWILRGQGHGEQVYLFMLLLSWCVPSEYLLVLEAGTLEWVRERKVGEHLCNPSGLRSERKQGLQQVFSYKAEDETTALDLEEEGAAMGWKSKEISARDQAATTFFLGYRVS